MRVLKDDKVAGFLPSAEAFAVHYPGYPLSMSRAINTLGGTEGIQKARSSQSNRLQLHFRPEDPYSHPTYGDLRPCNNLLLKISKNKSTNPSGQSAENSNRTSLQDKTNLDNKILRSIPEDGLIPSTKEVEAQISEDNQTNICAYIVARISDAYHFDGMVDYQHVVAVHADVSCRKKRNWMEVEDPPIKKGGLIDGDKEDVNVMILVPPLFAPKDVPENLVILSRVAYYFSSGPFLRFWIRKGYDPRKEPHSRMKGKFVTSFSVYIWFVTTAYRLWKCSSSR